MLSKLTGDVSWGEISKIIPKAKTLTLYTPYYLMGEMRVIPEFEFDIGDDRLNADPQTGRIEILVRSGLINGGKEYANVERRTTYNRSKSGRKVLLASLLKYVRENRLLGVFGKNATYHI